MARGAAAQRVQPPPPQIDPAAFGESIPTGDDDGPPGHGAPGSLEVSSVNGEAIPPPIGMDPPEPRAYQSPGRRPAAAPRGNGAAVQPTAKKELSRLLPSAHRVYVHKRSDDGKLDYCNEYSAQDLNGSGTIESFLHKWVVKEYGYGEFHLFMYDGTTEKPRPIGSVGVKAPASALREANGHAAAPTPPQKPSELLKELADMQTQLASMQAAQPAAKSPTEEFMGMMKQMQEMKLLMGGAAGADKPSSGMDPMMLFFLMKDMGGSKADPRFDALMRGIEKLADRIERMEEDARIAAMMPPPGPPPSSEPVGRTLIEVLLENQRESNRMVIEAIKERDRRPDRDPVSDLAALAKLNEGKGDTITTKDLFDMLPKWRAMFLPTNDADPFEKTIQNFRLFKMMQREFGDERPSAPEGDGAAGFWSFAKEMLRSDVGKGIAGAIVAQTAGQQAAAVAAARRQGAQQNASQVQAQRQGQQPNRQGQPQQQRPAQGQRPPAQGHPPQQQRPPVRPDPRLGPADPQAAPITEQMGQPTPVAAAPARQPAPSPPPQRPEEEGGDLQVPEGFLTVHAEKINSAAEDHERIGAIIQGLQLLGTSPDFRPHLAQMFGCVKQNRRLEALDILKEVLEFFAENEVLNEGIPAQAIADFTKHWDIIRQQLGFPLIPEAFPEGHPNHVPPSDAPSEEAGVPENAA